VSKGNVRQGRCASRTISGSSVFRRSVRNRVTVHRAPCAPLERVRRSITASRWGSVLKVPPSPIRVGMERASSGHPRGRSRTRQICRSALGATGSGILIGQDAGLLWRASSRSVYRADRAGFSAEGLAKPRAKVGGRNDTGPRLADSVLIEVHDDRRWPSAATSQKQSMAKLDGTDDDGTTRKEGGEADQGGACLSRHCSAPLTITSAIPFSPCGRRASDLVDTIGQA
jgi:hypothetical protein